MEQESKQSMHQRLKCLMQSKVRTPRIETAIADLKTALGLDENKAIKQVDKPSNQVKEGFRKVYKIPVIELNPLRKP